MDAVCRLFLVVFRAGGTWAFHCPGVFVNQLRHEIGTRECLRTTIASTMTMLRALAALVALWPAVICAQAERVTIRLAPAPGQRLHTRMAGEGHLVVEDEHQADAAPSPPFNLHLATTIGLTRGSSVTKAPSDASTRA